MKNKFAAGTAGRDAEIKGTKNGGHFVKFSIKHDYDPETRQAQFTDITVFGTLSGYAAGIKKGMPVLAYGREDSREYNGKTYISIVADCVVYNDNESDLSGGTNKTFDELKDDDGDLPF